MTVIYNLINSLLFTLVINQAFAQEDLASFCFERSVNLEDAKESLSFLLLPNEKAISRQGDHCLDVLTSPHRVNLLDKFLRKRYTLVTEVESGNSLGTEETCQLEFKVINDVKVNSKKFQLGEENTLKAGERSSKEISTSQLLLGLGKPGILDLDGRSLNVLCRKNANALYQLIFAFEELGKARIKTELSTRKNEVVDVAQVIKDLNEKSKTLGLPETNLFAMEGRETVKYELQIK